ncbi:pentapeptide repeat-containing protein [Streptomyces coffeae]|uniref:Pentapeptide repeat-containing protein n=1 Tax=Streptomyces coffeae TaxID=621382 RepID=A0ABS1NIJ3_9ACTN|nr:pentapeptide repeat-containing protein [Streptomyces coffeae]MBL1099932.1 pentapeptide repeat-containing protein [Streptomyces coffeae]
MTLPDLKESVCNLSETAALESDQGIVREFRYADADLRALDLAHTRLTTGHIARLRASRVRFEALRLHSIEIDGSELNSARWNDSKLSRVAFRDCKIMGASFVGLTLEDVLFENCRLDYTAFDQVRAIGPVAFSRCVLSETSFMDCDLGDVVFDRCTLRLTEFGRGRYRGLDLRGNDLSSVRGVASLGRVVIDRSQRGELTNALMAELDVTYGDDLSGPLTGQEIG